MGNRLFTAEGPDLLGKYAPWAVDLMPQSTWVQLGVAFSILFSGMAFWHRFRLWRVDLDRVRIERFSASLSFLLKLDSIQWLEDLLIEFKGSAVVITHDRWFLDRVATHILAFEGDSQVTWFEGSYAEYEEHRRKELGADADTPHRIRFKPLTRD